ncbi:MAG: hypothetical protein HY578_06510, partial [Nitrospinae bacterium]|nr:hypothetical protein [Nitrospinota bacterium]
TTPLTIKFISGKASGKAFSITANNGNTLTCGTSADFGDKGVQINDEFIITLPSIPQVSLNRWQARVIDCARQIYVNDRSSNIRTILDNLGVAIGSPLPVDIGTNAIYGIITKRPSDGYLTKEDVRYILRINSSTIAQGEERYNAIKDYITTVAYTDTLVSMECGISTVPVTALTLTDGNKNWTANWSTLNVVAYNATDGYFMGNISSNTPTVLTVGNWSKSDGIVFTPTAITNSQYSIIIPMPSAPVNINTARKEVLYALLSGLSDGTNTITGEVAGPIEMSNAAIGNDTAAERIAAAIIADPDYGIGKTTGSGPGIKTWKEFYDLIDHCSGATTGATAHTDVTGTSVGIGHTHSYITTAQARVIKANFNPNARWIGWNRNSSQAADAYAFLSKSDLAYKTLEFSFNSGGYYEIESFSLLNDDVGNTLSQKKIKTIAKVFDIWRQTTQADFEQRNTGEIEATHVARMSNVQTYPEFGGENTPANSAGTTPAATFDGQVMLTIQKLSSDANTTFRVGFDQVADGTAHVNNTNDDLNANTSNGGTPGTDYTAGGTTNAVEETSVVSAPNRGDMSPEGVYIAGSGTSGENLYYPLSSVTIPNNFPAATTDEGALEMWVKPNYDSGDGFDHYFFSFQNGGPPPTEYIRLFDNNGTLRFQVKDDTNILLEATYNITGWNANEWNHIAVTWDWDNSPLDDGSGVSAINLFVNGVPVTGTGTAIYNVNPLPTNMYIGSDANAPNTANWANATIDEVRISNNLRYTADFSATLPDRYYDDGDDFTGSPATFTSITFPDTAFATPVTWGTITWTQYTPTSGVSSQSYGALAFDIQTIGGSSPRTFPALSGSPDFTNPASNNRINALSSVSSSTQLQYRARLAGTGTPLIDTPLLDDVTITYFQPVKFLYWREVAE